LLSEKQIKLLELLDKQIQKCTKCDLYKNGRCKPYWTPEVKYVMVLEAPGFNEVEKNTPVVGDSGKELWKIANHFSLPREHFLIINSVNCRPILPGTNRNGKPTKYQIETCRDWVRKYIKVLSLNNSVEKGIVMGGYSLFTIFHQEGIMKMNSSIEYSDEFKINFVKSIHPAMCIYSGDRGKSMLFESFKSFVEAEKYESGHDKERESDDNRYVFF
jgi:uracil-DNA glycosylase